MFIPDDCCNGTGTYRSRLGIEIAEVFYISSFVTGFYQWKGEGFPPNGLVCIDCISICEAAGRFLPFKVACLRTPPGLGRLLLNSRIERQDLNLIRFNYSIIKRQVKATTPAVMLCYVCTGITYVVILSFLQLQVREMSISCQLIAHQLERWTGP